MSYLRITTDFQVYVTDLPAGVSKIGRSRKSDISIDDPSVSKLHCIVEVIDGAVWVVNESRYGTKLDGEPVETRTQWQTGKRLKIGNTSLTWHPDNNRSGNRIAERNTSPDAATGAETSATVNVRTTRGHSASLELPDFDDDSSRIIETDSETQPAAATSAESELRGSDTETEEATSHVQSGLKEDQAQLENKDVTQEMYTLGLTPDEVAKMRLEMRQKRGYRQAGVGLLLLLFLSAGGIGLRVATRAPAPENVLSWPADTQGNYLSHSYEAPLGGFRIECPGSSSEHFDEGEGVFEINCRLGLRNDASLVLRVEDKVDLEWTEQSLSKLADDWMLRNTNSREMLFDEPSFGSHFIGDNSGVPFVFVRFSRVDKSGKDWFGYARIFRSGSRLSVVSTSTTIEKLRLLESLLPLYYVILYEDYINAYWEPLAAKGGEIPALLLDDVNRSLKRDIPLLWSKMEEQLRIVLTISEKQQDTVNKVRAVNALTEIRDQKRIWYNQKSLAFERALDLRHNNDALRIKQQCLSVFNDPLDRRYDIIRTWSTE